MAYWKTALLTHDATGPTGGREKLIGRFYGFPKEEPDWRESVFMRRLGLSEQDISLYKGRAEQAETYTGTAAQ